MRETDGFVDAVAENLLDRLEDCRKAFPSALCLGGSAGAVRRLLHGRGEPPITPLLLLCTNGGTTPPRSYQFNPEMN